MSFNNKGTKLAWSDGKSITVHDIQQGQNVSLDAERTQFMQWSPQDTYLTTWEVFAVRDGRQDPNLKIWDVSNAQTKASFISRKSDGWQPRWSQNETMVAVKTPNNEVAFFKDHQFETPDKRLSVAKMDSFSVSPSCQNVVVFVPGKKGAPGFAKVSLFEDFVSAWKLRIYYMYSHDKTIKNDILKMLIKLQGFEPQTCSSITCPDVIRLVFFENFI